MRYKLIMKDLEREESSARPSLSRAFLEHRPLVLPGWAAHFTFWPLMAVGLALDLWTKRAVFDWLQQEQSNGVSIIDGFLQFIRAKNAGAAFGIATGQTQLLAAVSVVALVVIFVVFLLSGTEKKLVHIALGLFAAGVCGNLHDRIFYDGFVRDFIDIVYWPGRHWPAFNIADSMLCIAVALLIISAFTEKSSRKRAQQHK